MTTDRMALREYLCSLIDFNNANRVLDIGCGTGEDLKRMGEIQPRHDCKFIGIDRAEESLKQAKGLVQGDERYEFLNHDLSLPLPFDNEYFDAVFSRNVLECIVDKESFLREVARVLKANGQIVFAHWDWDSQTIDGSDKALIRKIIHTYCDWKQDWMDDADGWMGRRLWRTFQHTGLFDGNIHGYVLTNTKFEAACFGHKIISSFESLVRRKMLAAEEYEQFLEDIRSLARNDEYFYGLTMYIYAGRKREP